MAFYTLKPISIFENQSGAWSVQGTGSLGDDNGAWDDDAGYYRYSTGGSTAARRLLANMSAFLPVATGINGIQVLTRGGQAGIPAVEFNHRVVLRVGGTNYFGGTIFINNAPFYGTFSQSWATNPFTGAAWTPAEMSGLIAGQESANTRAGEPDVAKCSAIQIRVDYNGSPGPLEPIRQIVSRRLWDLREPKAMLTLDVPLHVGLDLDVMDDVMVVNYAGPHDTDPGWLDQDGLRRLMKVYAIEYTPGAATVRLLLRDRRRNLILALDSMQSVRSTSSLGIGIARIDKGCTRTFTRPSEAYGMDPAAGFLTKILQDQEGYVAGGELFEGPATNQIIQAAFKNGVGNAFTGWTPSVVGDGLFEADTAELLWDPVSSGVPRSLRITQPSTITGSSHKLTGTTWSVGAGEVGRLSLWSKDADAAKPGFWNLLRASDGKVWDDATGGWVSGGISTWNYAPGNTAWHRQVSKRLANVVAGGTGGGATTYALAIGGGNTSSNNVPIAGQINWFGHVQYEANAWASSEILTEATAVLRAASRLLLSNNDGKRWWSTPLGGSAWEVFSNCNSADIASGRKVIDAVLHDANNSEIIYYDFALGAFVYARKAAGVTTAATFATPLVRDTLYEIGTRQVGALSEVRLAPFTHSIFVNKVKGTDAIGAAAPTQAASCNVEIGSEGAANWWEGRIRQAHSYQYPPDDAEMAQLLE